MFDLVRNNKKIVQVFLVLITLPFAFWGLESYVGNADLESGVASVGETKITEQELQTALREQADRLRAQLGGGVDPAMFQTPQMRRAVLESLINQKLMALRARDGKLTVSDSDLVRFISAVPALQENGKFSPERYAALVASQGMSKEMFEAQLRQDLAMQQLIMPVAEGAIMGTTSARLWQAAQLEQRTVAEARLSPESYIPRVKLDAEAVRKYYDSNRSLFELPEQVRVEYVVLGPEATGAQVAIGDEEIKARYAAKAEQYKEGETRRASHILIRVAKDAPDAELQAARARAEELLVQARKSPAGFAQLARTHSQDPGSAANGGDLGWFGRGMMVKPFEEAVFALKEGGISDVVRSDFGFHVIRLAGVKAERLKPLADVRADIVEELRAEQISRRHAEAAEAFGNMVYEQADSLKPAAEKWKLPLQQSAWLAKGGKLPAPFDSPKLAGLLFGDDAVKNRRNTEAVEVAPGTLVSARVIEHKPATLVPLEDARKDIEKRLVAEEAAKLAAKDGEAMLARLARGEAVDIKWSAPRALVRMNPQGLPSQAVRAVFQADAGKLPAHAGVDVPGAGYLLFRISAVRPGDVAADPALAAVLAQHYARLAGEEEFTAWMASLKGRYPVDISQAAVAPPTEAR